MPPSVIAVVVVVVVLVLLPLLPHPPSSGARPGTRRPGFWRAMYIPTHAGATRPGQAKHFKRFKLNKDESEF